jgi:type III secretion protein L
VDSKQLFSLIYGPTVGKATNAKIVRRDDFSKLLNSQEVLETIIADAEKYRQSVVSECEALKEQAQKEGFAEGYQEWAQHIAKLEEEISKVREEMQKLIIPVSLKAAKKIVSSELALQPAAILEIVTNALKSVSQHKRIVIYVNKNDLELLESSKGKIKQIFEALESLSIRDRDDVEQGGCIIETEGGIINAQLKDRWRNLESAFESLAETIKKG